MKIACLMPGARMSEFHIATDTNIPILTFSLGEQMYALPISEVIEVAAMVALIDVDDPRPEVLGIANRHGEILPVLDLRVMLRQQVTPIDPSTLFIVVYHHGLHFGLVTSEVHQVAYMRAQALFNARAPGRHVRSIVSWEQQVIQILDLASLLAPYLPASNTDLWFKGDG